MDLHAIQKSWFGNVKGDILAGIVVALALIPEAIAFSIIAGLDPMVGLYASFCMAVVIAFVGGRPGMISAFTGAMALLMVTLVAEHGLQYLWAATILTGILQIVFGWLKLARYMKFIPRSVMIGFVNALAILIFMAQIDHFVGASWVMYVMVIGTLAIIYLVPLVIKAVPSTLLAIIFMTIVAVTLNLDVKTVGDMGELPTALPAFVVPSVPLTIDTILIIFPYAFALAMVGIIESLLTASIVDDMTDSDSNKNKESRGQGIANIVSGLFGGAAGCAMIGQSVINVKSGGTGRLSALVAGVVLMILILGLADIVVQIPIAALAGVMIMVSISTFDWGSLRQLTIMPRTDATVLVVTVGTVVYTHDLAKGVFAGVILSAIFFAAKISKINVQGKLKEDGTKIYTVEGQLFFVSVTDFIHAFDFNEEVRRVEIDFMRAHLWDDSAVGAVDKVVLKYTLNHIEVKLTGMNEQSRSLLERLTSADGR